MRRHVAIALVAIATLSGCGTYVQVRHPWVTGKLAAVSLPKVRRIYIVASRPNYEDKVGTGGKVAGSLLARALGADLEASAVLPPGGAAETAMLKACARALSSPWVEVAGWQVRGALADRMIADMRPTAVLEVTPGLITGSQEVEERKQTDDRGRVTGTRTVASLRAEFPVSWRLLSYPDRAVLASGDYRLQSSSEEYDKVHLRGWLETQTGLMAAWPGDMAREVLPHPVVRRRKVRTDKDGPLKAEWNSGVESEKAGFWDSARAHYRAALASAAKPGDREVLGHYLAELDLLAGDPAPPPAPGADPWFGEPVALLPFANESNNVEAPVILRSFAAGRLAAMGYPLVPMDDIDARLRSAGVSSGDQLRSLTPAKLAEAVGTRRLIFGTVEGYSTVNIGIYYKREVRVRFAMPAASGTAGWESTGVCRRAIAPENAGKAFIGGLVGKVVDKATGTYLKEEGESAVTSGLATLPAKQSASR